MSTTTPRKPFTDVTWSTAAPSGFLTTESHEHARGWMAQCDLGYEMAESGGLDVALCRLLVDATLAGMPVVVKHRGRNGALFTETVLIQHLGRARKDPGVQGYMHVRMWGGSHPIYYSDIIAAGTPESVFEFDAHGRHHTITHPWRGEEAHEITEALSS